MLVDLTQNLLKYKKENRQSESSVNVVINWDGSSEQ